MDDQSNAAIDKPEMRAFPADFDEGRPLLLEGAGWPSSPITFDIGQKPPPLAHVAIGLRASASTVIPDADGRFAVSLNTFGWDAGDRTITARSSFKELAAATTIVVRERARFRPDGRVNEIAHWRARDFFERRFGHLGYVPPRTREVQIESWRRLDPDSLKQPPSSDLDRSILFSRAEIGRCNWTPVGPAGALSRTSLRPEVSAGRTRCLAIDPMTPTTLYAGTASGGVWKSTDEGATWVPKTDDAPSLAIGALAIDPADRLRVWAGTGEYNPTGSFGGLYYGMGLLRSRDGFEDPLNVEIVAGDVFGHAEITRILFDPVTPSRMYVSCSTGVYESTDAGNNRWTRLGAPGMYSALSCSDLAVVRTESGEVRMTAAIYEHGLFTTVRTGESWSPWQVARGSSAPSLVGRIVIGQCRTRPEFMYAAYTYDASLVSFLRSVDGGESWTRPTIRFNVGSRIQSNEEMGHLHTLTISPGDFSAEPIVGRTFRTTTAADGHDHGVALTNSELASVARFEALDKASETSDRPRPHAHRFFSRPLLQPDWDLHVSVHPTDPNTVYFGEFDLYRSTNGGTSFEPITDTSAESTLDGVGRIHVDQHSVAFHPSRAETIYATNDGGVYRSATSGRSWQHRNRNLATIQYLHVATHPRWEAMALAGAQDNGTYLFTGEPAWDLTVGGDSGYCGFDPSNHLFVYGGSLWNQLHRSDRGGLPVVPHTWIRCDVPTPNNRHEFYPPLEIDPSGTLFWGGESLWVSPAPQRGNEWFSVTGVLAQTITAIAIHPRNSGILYVGTRNGRVYRVERTGSAWMRGGASTTLLPTTGLPSNVWVSDLAVDSMERVWLTLSSILYAEEADEFSYRHVFRFPSRTADSWEERSTGLAEANPINTIAIDPDNDNHLFCGGDIGVFRTIDGGGRWERWDHGLPNAPIYHLVIHRVPRLLRAATYGRGVWERSITDDPCPPVDIYVRDNYLDTGRLRPSPTNVLDPLDPTTSQFLHWWHSPDVKVDAPEPTFQTTEVVADHISFNVLRHRSARRKRTVAEGGSDASLGDPRGVPNRFYLQVHNRGPFVARGVRARAFFADASMRLPDLPPNFWPDPFGGAPTPTDWRPIDDGRGAYLIGDIQPGTARIAAWEWRLPAGTARHQCLLALVTADDDPLRATTLNVGELVQNHKHATLKNLIVEPAVRLDPLVAADEFYVLEMHGDGDDGEYEVVVEWGNLPPDAFVRIAFEKDENDSAGTAPPSSKSGAGFPGVIESRSGTERPIDLEQIYHLEPDKTGQARITGIAVPGDGPRAMLLKIELAQVPNEAIGFTVTQRRDDHILGGTTFLFPVEEKLGQESSE